MGLKNVINQLAEKNKKTEKLTGKNGAGVTKPRPKSQGKIIDYFTKDNDNPV